LPRTYKPRYQFPVEDRDLVDKWINSYAKWQSRNAYFFGLANFKRWFRKPLSEWLKLPSWNEKKPCWEKIALDFQNFAVNNPLPDALKPLSVNTVLTALRALASFTYYHKHETFKLRRGQRLQNEMDTDSHIFKNGDIARMFDVGDPQQKAIVATFASLGWEFSGVLGLDRKRVEKLIAQAEQAGERFVYINEQRGKTGVPRFASLNPLAIEYLKKYWQRWKGPPIFKIRTKGGLNEMLHQLAEKSGIVLTGSVHSHLFRKWVMGQLSRAGWNDYQISYYVGKKIPGDKQTYLLRLEQDIREMFPETYEKYLTLRPEKVNEDVKRRIAALEKENQELRSRPALSDEQRRALDLLTDSEVLDYLMDGVKKRKASL
jgi:hypothetical protein